MIANFDGEVRRYLYDIACRLMREFICARSDCWSRSKENCGSSEHADKSW